MNHWKKKMNRFQAFEELKILWIKWLIENKPYAADIINSNDMCRFVDFIFQNKKWIENKNLKNNVNLLGLYLCRICIIAWLGYSIQRAFFEVLLMEQSWSNSQVYLERESNVIRHEFESKKITFFSLISFDFLYFSIRFPHLHSSFVFRIKQLTNEKYIFKTFHFSISFPIPPFTEVEKN